jgi:hypothetical protein
MRIFILAIAIIFVPLFGIFLWSMWKSEKLHRTIEQNYRRFDAMAIDELTVCRERLINSRKEYPATCSTDVLAYYKVLDYIEDRIKWQGRCA